MPATLADREAERTEFQEILAAANARHEGREPEEQDPPAESAAEAPPEPTPGEEPPPVVPPPAEPSGPSEQWKAIAASRGVPRELIATARDNDQLQQFIALVDDEPAEPAKPAEAAKPPWLLKDEEFDATDPAHRQLKAHGEHLAALEARVSEKLARLETAAQALIKNQQQDARLALSRDFDSGVDDLAMPEIGPSLSPKRQEAFALYEYLVSANPHAPRGELAKRAVRATFPDLLTRQARDAQLAALKTQQAETVGGGPNKPAPKKEPTPKEKFLTLLRSKIKP